MTVGLTNEGFDKKKKKIHGKIALVLLHHILEIVFTGNEPLELLGNILFDSFSDN